MSYRPPNIASEGLQNHMEKLDLDYHEFDKRMKLNEPYTVIGKAIGRHPITIAKYAKQWQKEQGGNAEDSRTNLKV